MTPLEDLEAAVQRFVNSLSDEAPLLHSAALVWETVRYNDDGQMGHRMSYASVTGSMAATVGLLSYGHAQVLEDLIDSMGDD